MWMDNDELLSALRNQAIIAKAKADGAYQAWRIAAEEFAKKKLVSIIGRLPSPCVVDIGHGDESILIEAVKVYWGSDMPFMLFRRRTKSGKWAKIVYSQAIPDRIRPIPPKSPEPAD